MARAASVTPPAFAFALRLPRLAWDIWELRALASELAMILSSSVLFLNSDRS